jgi:alkylation response protein AidB-like acyl-CoA dehydrogenase
MDLSMRRGSPGLHITLRAVGITPRGHAGLAMAIVGTCLAAVGIAARGAPEQIMEWVPQCYGSAEKLASGAFCASEPDAGSDVGAYRLSAKYDEVSDEWVLNGTKAWITNGGIADIHVVVAAVDRLTATYRPGHVRPEQLRSPGRGGAGSGRVSVSPPSW